MRIENGLFDHIVLQRTRKNVSDAVLNGIAAADGNVHATVRKAGKVLPRFNCAAVGRSSRGRFIARLKGLSVGGPYSVKLEVRDGDRVVDRLTVNDVLVGDVWILGGQSNMEGCGFRKDSPMPHPMVHAFYMTDTWGVAKDPLHVLGQAVDDVHLALCGGVRAPYPPVTGGGCGVAFGRRLYERTGVPQGLLACAHGGTSMAQWDPGLKKLGGKSLYGATIRRLRKNGGKAAGVIWYQGESDADGTIAPLYTGRMKKLISALRRDTNNPALPFVLVQLSRVIPHARNDGWNSIQEQQRLLPTLIRNCAAVPAIDLSLEDGIHISGAGQNHLGRRLADAMLSITHRGKDATPPIAFRKRSVILDKKRMLINIAVEYDNVVGRLTAAGRPSGFTVVTASSPDAVYDVQLSGNKAIVRTGMIGKAEVNSRLHYGFGSNPYCNITDEADRSLPVMGPMLIGPSRTVTPFVQTLRISRFMPSAGKLEKLDYPASLAPLKLRTQTFAGTFCDRHVEIQQQNVKDVMMYFVCDINCSEKMNLAVLLGYDGPVKMWIDGKLRYFDPNGINPAIAGSHSIRLRASRGRHEIMVALGSNNLKAWGIFLNIERLDVSRALLRKSPNQVVMPVVLG